MISRANSNTTKPFDDSPQSGAAPPLFSFLGLRRRDLIVLWMITGLLLLVAFFFLLNSSADKSPPKIAASRKIDINKAKLGELMLLPGIGEQTAKAILRYRKENGSFKRVEDIRNVPRIGDSLLAKIQDRITVGEKDR